MESKNIMIVGVGGQGSLLASKLLGKLLLSQGCDVKVSEVHGMSQRGGSVVTYVRAGERVCSPVIEPGEADFVLAFEKLEGARFAPYLKPGGVLIVNTQEIDPMPVITGKTAYPSDILSSLSGITVEAADALALAEAAGSAKAVNVVLLAKLAKYLPVPYEKWVSAIENAVAPRFTEMNLKAFKTSYDQ